MSLKTLSSNILHEITPSKWTMFKFFFKVGIIGIGASYYFHAINEQTKVNDKGDFLSSFEQVIKNQYDTIKSPFLNLLNKAEGFQNTFYPDNKGYAVGYGYNPTQNSKSYNKSILDYADIDEETKQKIIQNSEKYKNEYGKTVPNEFKNIKFSKTQLDKMAIYAQNSYEKSFYRVLINKLNNKNIQGDKRIKIVTSYVTMPENKKVVLIHMAYKVGEKNLEKYNNFFNNLILFLETPNEKNKKAVAESFTYKYAKNKQMLHDTRVEKLHHDLFMKDLPKELSETNKNIKEVKNIKTIKAMNEKEKFQLAMKEVNNQITIDGALKLLAKGINKIHDTIPNSNKNSEKINNSSNKSQPIEEDEDYIEYEDEQPEQYYESDKDVQIIINGQKILVKQNQSIQINNNNITIKKM